ncbi:MAG: NAD kinase [Bacteroidales bacterium]|jgi:NAD+ kinase|nr:NAD kinase [Bacteroidales bacterium]
MNILFFGKKTTGKENAEFQRIVNDIEQYCDKIFLYRETADALENEIDFGERFELIDSILEVEREIDFFISVGGDGTFLDAAAIIGQTGIPVLGVNIGRLGFLSSIAPQQVKEALLSIRNGEYKIEKRMLLNIEASAAQLSGKNTAVNDVCVQRLPPGGMISIEVSVNEQHLNTYRADGLIVATPTGSTAYSLGCGGPIIVPEAEVFVLTPIAPHSLTVRPIVIPAQNTIRIKVNSRGDDFYLSIDSNNYKLTEKQQITIKKSNYFLNVLHLKSHSFYHTISQKLKWGIDDRNQ